MIFATGKINRRAAFTLIELILVMTVMVIVLAIVFPSLMGFFRGRNLGNEAQRFMSMIRYGQSRAIAEGLPVELWIDQRQKRYGLQGASGYTETQTNPVVYTLDPTVQITFSPPSSTLTRSNVWTPTQGQIGGLAKIRFQPDGFISDNSPESIFFTQPGTGDEMWIAVNPTHLRYELQTGQPPNLRR